MNNILLKDYLIEITKGTTPTTIGGEFIESGVNFVKAECLNTGRIIDKSSLSYISPEIHKKLNRSILQEDDLLFSIAGHLGKMAIVRKEDLPANTNQAVAILRIDQKKGDVNFLYYYLNSTQISNYIRKQCAQSVQPNLNLAQVGQLPIIVYSLPTQKSIAKVLSDLDAKIELNNKINRELEAMAKTLYDYWFVQFDFPTPPSSTSGIVGKPYKSSGGKMVYNAELKREIPEGWEVGTVEDYCRIFTGKKDVNQSLEIGKYKFFSCAPGYKYSDEKLYEGKAILVSGNGSYTGRTIFVDEGFDLYQRTYACVNKTETDYLAYIYYSMLRYMSLKINGGTHGSAIPYIVFDDIAKEIIVINHNLINKFQNIVYPLINKIMNNNKQAVELAKLRDWLLPMLMNGQVASRASATAK